MEELLGQIYQGVATVLGLALVYVLRFAIVEGRKFMRLRLGNERAEALEREASSVVRYLEQTGKLTKLSPEEKLAQALGWLDSIATEKGISVDFDELQRLIEAQVQIMNAELAKEPVFVEFTDSNDLP